jgi:hypothetical protein
MSFYQSQIDKLYMENDLDLSKDNMRIFPDHFLLILILWVSFQLDKIIKQIQPATIVNQPVEDTLFALKVENMKRQLEKQAEGDKST